MTARAVKRSYKYRFYPTPEQAVLLICTFGCVRYVYNRALAERSRAWTQERRRVTFAETCRMLTAWKADPETAWLYEVSSVALQQGLQHLQQAYVNFWGKRAKYPRFKSKRNSRASATFTTSGFRYRAGQLTLAKMTAPLDIRWSRPLPDGAEPSTVTVTRDAAGRWHISIMVEEAVEALPSSDAVVGIDAGITSLVTLSTGEKVTNPRHERRDRSRLTLVQRRLSRKAKGSANRTKARLRVARVHARIADRRRDHLHKLSTRIIRENQTVIIEDLSVCNMVRNHTLARAISDASWAEFRAMLEYKADWYGRTVVAIDRFYPSSKTCSGCGHLLASLPLNVREWRCPACGVLHDRDVNAAKVIRAAGLAVLACGDGVRPARA
jgi:putative transposase